MFVSCEKIETEYTVLKEKPKREWTVVIYMAADNNLESAAILDMNELEASCFVENKISVLVLLDRAEGGDGTNGDWTDTRLFEIKHDKNGKNGTIISKQIECQELDLCEGRETELDMGDPNTLDGLLDFAKRKYEAEHYALVLWGHGNGWRGGEGVEKKIESNEKNRAVAFDKATDSYLSVPNIGKAVKNKNLDIIAFDTCFGGIIEVFYELKDSAKYLVGSPGAVSVQGFDYTKMFDSLNLTGGSVYDMAECMALSTEEIVSIVDARGVSEIGNNLNMLAESIAGTIQSEEKRTETFSVFTKEILSYGENTYPSDFFLDVYDIAKKYSGSEISEIQTNSLKLMSCLEKSVVTKNSDEVKLGIYFGELRSRNSFVPVFSEYYTNSRITKDKSAFVNEFTGWVPTESNCTSLLDKLFNESF